MTLAITADDYGLTDPEAAMTLCIWLARVCNWVM